MAKKTGRPAFVVDETMIKKVESLAANGLTMEQIAQSLGIHYATLNKKQNQYKELDEAIKRGKAKGIATVTNALFKKATSGDNVSMIFYLKNRDPNNWRDKQEIEHSGGIGFAERLTRARKNAQSSSSDV
jgi:hypothetical protein